MTFFVGSTQEASRPCEVRSNLYAGHYCKCMVAMQSSARQRADRTSQGRVFFL